MKKVRSLDDKPNGVLVKLLRSGPWLINYRPQEDKVVQLLWATKGLDFLKN